MELTTAVKRLKEIKEANGAICGELTLFDDESGEIYFNFDDPDKENIEKTFMSLKQMEEIFEGLEDEETKEKNKNEEPFDW